MMNSYVLLFLTLGTINACDYNQYQDGDGYCYPCDPACSSCYGPDASSCYDCSEKYYRDPSYLCTICHHSCKRCSDGGPQSCTECQYSFSNQSYSYQSTTYYYCLTDVCAQNQFYYGGNCEQCSDGCKACSSSSSYQCVGCLEGYFESGYRTCSRCYIGCSECLNSGIRDCSTCQSGYNQVTLTDSANFATYYICLKDECQIDNKYTNDGSNCYDCNPACNNCYGSQSYECVSCATRHYQSGFSTCSNCDQSCETCTGGQPSDCTSCRIGYFQISPNLCNPCYIGCSTCSNSGIWDCSDCISSFSYASITTDFNTYYLCRSSTCSDSQFAYPSAADCADCNSACRTCFGSLSTQCFSCNSGYYMVSDMNCSPCFSTCATCSSEFNGDCSDCKSGSSHKSHTNASRTYGFCLGCSAKNYVNSSGGCSSCDPSCTICYDSGNDKCLECEDGYYLTDATECLPCQAPCQNCIGPNNGNCTSCPGTGSILKNYSYDSVTYGFCNNCTDGSYFDISTNNCQLCNSFCQTCYGPLSAHCLSCAEDYLESVFTTCVMCLQPCKKCSGLANGNCTSCRPQYTLYKYPYDGKNYGFCNRTSCTSAQYYNVSSSNCVSCNNPCDKCYGPTKFECFSCAVNYYLIPFTTCTQCYEGCSQCKAGMNGNCTQCRGTFTNFTITYLSANYTFCFSCPNGKYLSSSICEVCNSSCYICYGSTNTQCLNCSSGFYMTGFTTCLACSLGCSECTTNSSARCKGCFSGYFFYNYTFNLTSYGACLSTSCQDNTFMNSTSGACQACHALCVKCRGSGANQCYQCKNGSYQSGAVTCSSCHSSCRNCIGNTADKCIECPGLFYLEVVTSPSGSCKSCQQPCANCFGIANDDCSTCITDYYLEIKDNPKQSGVCKQCPTQCSICQNSYPDICKTCVYKHFFTQTNATQHTGHCSICHYSCASCDGPNDNNCLSCNNTAFRDIIPSKQCECQPFKMDDKHDHQQCVTLVCDWGSGKTVHPNIGRCRVICGDGLVGDGEECDDNNTANNDGCFNCFIENYYLCYNGSTTTTSVCVFVTPIGFTVTGIEKDPYSNFIKMTLTPNFTDDFMKELNFNLAMQLRFNYSSADFTYENGVVIGRISYSESIHLPPLEHHTMTVDISKINSTFNIIPAYDLNYNMVTSNNLAINYYSKSVYTQVNVVKNIGWVMLALGYTVFAAGMIRGKVVASELVLTLQLAYFGLACTKDVDPPMYGLQGLKYFNGYNDDFGIPNLGQDKFSPNFNNMGISSLLISNVNIMLLIPILLLLASLIMFTIQRNKRQTSISFTNKRKQMMGEYFLTAVIFISLPVSFSTTAMIMYLPSLNLYSIMSLAAGGIYLAMLVLAIVLFAIRDHWYFGEYKSFFFETNFCQFYFVLHLVQRLVIGAVLALLERTYFAGIAIAVILGGHSLFIAIFKPYSLKQENIRSAVNLLLSLFMVITYVGVGETIPDSDKGGFRTASCYIILTLLLSSIIFSGTYIWRQIRITIKAHIDTKMSIQKQEADNNIQKMFQNEMKTAMDNNRLTSRRLIKKKKKKTKRLSFSDIQIIQDENRLKDRILNFEKYEALWLENEDEGDVLKRAQDETIKTVKGAEI